MRGYTAAQEARMRSPSRATRLRIVVEDENGLYKDWSDIFGRDFVASLSMGEGLDDPGMTARIDLWWRQDHDNASPLVTGTRLEGYIDAGRRVFASVDVVGDPQDIGVDWVPIFDGVIDRWDFTSSPGSIDVRDRTTAHLQDSWIKVDTPYTRGEDPLPDLSEVAWRLIDDWTTLSQSQFYVPAAPGFAVSLDNQQPQSVHSGLMNLTSLIGWDIRTMYRDGFSEPLLTLYEPPRNQVTNDVTFDAGMIRSLSGVSEGREDIRNTILVYYPDGDTSGGQPDYKKVERVNAASVAKYGEQWMELVEGADSGIDTQGEAEDLADRILSDLSQPRATLTITIPFWWPIQLNDYVGIGANGTHFAVQQDMAVVGYEHNIDSTQATTTLTLAGRAKAGTTRWLEREARPGQGVSRDTSTPNTPGFLSATVGPLASDIRVEWSRKKNWDVLELYASDSPAVAIIKANLVEATRNTTIKMRTNEPGKKYYRYVLRDRAGNASEPSVERSADMRGMGRAQLSSEFNALKVKLGATSTPGPSPAIIGFDSAASGDAGMFVVSTKSIKPGSGGLCMCSVDVAPTGSENSGTWSVELVAVNGTAVRSLQTSITSDVSIRLHLTGMHSIAANESLQARLTYSGVVSMAATDTTMALAPLPSKV